MWSWIPVHLLLGKCSVQLKEYSGFCSGQVLVPARGQGAQFPEQLMKAFEFLD